MPKKKYYGKYKRDHDFERKKRRSVPMTISFSPEVYNILTKKANPNYSEYINKAIMFFNHKHSDPKEFLKKIQQHKKEIAKKMCLLQEKEKNVQEFIKQQKKKK